MSTHNIYFHGEITIYPYFLVENIPPNLELWGYKGTTYTFRSWGTTVVENKKCSDFAEFSCSDSLLCRSDNKQHRSSSNSIWSI